MKEDFNRLRLKYHGDAAMMHEILQRECRCKTAAKLPRTLQCDDFLFPSLAVAEMATSDSVAEIHASMIPEGSSVLDMTCGLGIDSFVFSKKASSVTTVELDRATYDAACHNIKALGLENVTAINGDSIEFLKDSDAEFDIIFVDPARRDSSGRHYAFQDCSPNIIPTLPLILSKCRRLIIKASPMIDIKGAVNELGRDCSVATIGTTKECKELVFIIDSEAKATTSPKILKTDCITVDHNSYSFTPEQESAAKPAYAAPQIGSYLYEPYPAVMKGGGMKLLSERFGVGKLHPNTHLFTSETTVSDFPGEIFEITDIYPFSKQGIKAVAAKYPSINVTTRNFPLSAPQLASKLKIKEGGDKMLFGLTAPDSSRLLVITSMGKPL